MSTSQTQTYYDILDIQRGASQTEIKQAFRKMAKKYHPDTNPEDEERATQKLNEIITAYRVLSNERERARYDVMMRTNPTLEQRETSESASTAEKTDEILQDLLAGRGRKALETYDELREGEAFQLSDHLDIRDYLDCLFLLAEQLERVGRHSEATEFYEELYAREKEPPRYRYFLEEVKERIKKLYSRKLPREADSAQEEIACYRRILEFDVDRSEKAFLLKKIAEVYCRIGRERKAKQIFQQALDLKPGLKGTATIREKLGMEEA